MEIIEIKGEKFELRNKGSEVSLNELARISQILDEKEVDFIERWFSVLEILASKEFVEKAGMTVFLNAIKSVNITEMNKEITTTIEVNGRSYSIDLDQGVIDLTARDLKKIEAMAKQGGAWANKAVAVVYKDDALTDNEHYDDAHISHKAKLFGESMTADVASPVIFQLSKVIVENIQNLVDAQNLAVQGA